jgi:asparagine synthase (glutamine-hydrolysing)
MCGIAGFKGAGDKEALTHMAHTLAHRGPDSEGVWQEGDTGFAHARLAIVDLSPTGAQPMKSTNATLTFNGEIFNYKTLREELARGGYHFVGTSDTEVILALYETYGEDAFEKLVGQFAFALYDKRSEALYLVRDRMGEKPLYWGTFQNTFVFASEPKAIFAHGIPRKSLNMNAVESYLTYDAVLAPQSIFEHIQKLPPASFLVYKEGKHEIKKYWQPPQTVDYSISKEEAEQKLNELFSKSVASELIADVPVGIFLSGGLDSSLIAYYAQQGRTEPLHTFSLGFKEKSYDESSYAQKVAQHLGTEHHEHIVSAKDIQNALPRVTQMLDEPVADPAILPNYLLAQFAKEKVKVVLGGDGGDELFSGYQTFVAEKMLGVYKTLPAPLRAHLIEPLVNALPVSHAYFSLDFKAKQFIKGAHTDLNYLHQAWLESFSAEEQQQILVSHARRQEHSHYAQIDAYLSEVAHAPRELKTSYLYLRTYMQDVILAKVDRSSMMHGLEVRAPFLDKTLVEYALSLPAHLKLKGFTTKYILREMMKDKLPSEIVARGKHGFGLPVGSWFMHEWSDLLHDTLSHKRIKEMGIFEPTAVTKLIEEHQSGAKNHRKKLWSLLTFALWYDTWNT